MTRRTFAAGSGALCVLGFITLTAFRPSFLHRQVSGRVLAIEGAAQGIINGKKIALTSASFVHPGETVTSSEKSRVELMLLPGVLIELAGDAEIEIRQLRLLRDGDETIHPMIARDARIRLQRGTLVALVVQAQTDSHLFVETPAGTLVAGPDRTFKVGVAGNKARILCIRGKVAVQQADAQTSLRVPAGYLAELPMAQAGPRAAAGAGAEVQAEVPEVLSSERRLGRLEQEHGSDYKPW